MFKSLLNSKFIQNFPTLSKFREKEDCLKSITASTASSQKSKFINDQDSGRSTRVLTRLDSQASLFTAAS